MYVNEFARRLGLTASKMRYYDRSGLYQSRRGENNYRDFTDADALDAYLAQSLRANAYHAQPGADETWNTDVLVIGGGGAGLSAAISAARNGAKVILIEKSSFLGGNAIADIFTFGQIAGKNAATNK